MNNNKLLRIVSISKWASMVAMVLFIINIKINNNIDYFYYALIISLIFFLASIEALISGEIGIGGFLVAKEKSKYTFYSVILFLIFASISFIVIGLRR